MKDIPDEIMEKVNAVMEKQKIDGFSTEEFRILISLRKAFEYSINSIDQILSNDDVISALGDIVRDWNVDAHNRNNVIVKDMETLQGALKYLKSKNTEES